MMILVRPALIAAAAAAPVQCVYDCTLSPAVYTMQNPVAPTACPTDSCFQQLSQASYSRMCSKVATSYYPDAKEILQQLQQLRFSECEVAFENAAYSNHVA